MAGVCTIFVLCAVILGMTSAQSSMTSQQCSPDLDNVSGCKMIRDPTFIIVAPRKVRPLQVLNVIVTILHMEYPLISVRVSIVRDHIEYTANTASFSYPGTKVVELLLPKKAVAGRYSLKAKGVLKESDSGSIFERETSIEFDRKQASVFVQLSKPFFNMGQTVRFRIVPVLPNLMASTEGLTLYVEDPSGTEVRRWQGQQLNAGGFVQQSYDISDRPTYGDWHIKVDFNGYITRKKFEVQEYWGDMFNVNVSVPVYILSDLTTIEGVVTVNHTSGKGARGNAMVSLQIVPAEFTYNYEDTSMLPTPLDKPVPFFENGRFDMSFTRDEILQHADATTMAGMEFHFNVSVTDWILNFTYGGFGSTFCHEARTLVTWVGDPVRTFTPDTLLTLTVALTHADGTAVTNVTEPVIFTTETSGGSGGSNTLQPRPVTPVGGFASMDLRVTDDMTLVKSTARYGNVKSHELRAHKYYSPADVYISVTTSTKHPRVNEYMIFHVRTSVYVSKVYYQIVAQGNILLADELSMISRQKTISIALSRDMIPTARIVVYCVRQPNHIISDALNFYVNGTRLNPIHIGFNRGKDFTLHTVEVTARSDPGSYAAFSAIPYDLYTRGLSDGLSENEVIDELLTYDQPANGSYRHKMRLSDNEYVYKFFHSKTHGIDAFSVFKMAGLAILTDADSGILPNTKRCTEDGQLPCNDGTSCYTKRQKCDGVYDCVDGADESGCPKKELLLHRIDPIRRIAITQRFYDDNDWIWQEQWIKPDGRIDFRVTVPSHPLTWVVNAFSLSADKGFGIMHSPARFDATRLMYITVEAPQYVVRYEQIGIRVTVFNYWYGDDYLEVLVKLHDSPNYKFIHVEDLGLVDTMNPRTSFGEHMTLVYLEAGESRDIYLPVLPVNWEDGQVDVTVSATSYLSSDTVTTTLEMQYEGVTNYFFTPYLVDLIQTGIVEIPDIDLPMPQTHIRRESFRNSAHTRLKCLQKFQGLQENFKGIDAPDTYHARDARVSYEGVTNYFFTPYLVDLIQTGIVEIPDIDLPMPQTHIKPETREFQYIPGSGAASVNIYGDVVTPGYFEPLLTSSNTVGKPYGTAEANAFNLAYNTITLNFKKDAKQLTLTELNDALTLMNIMYQRQLSYMNNDSSFHMFLYDMTPNIWLTSFVARTLSEARNGEWETILYIPIELIDSIVGWICKQQKTDGSFAPIDTIYDLKMVKKTEQLKKVKYDDPVSLTAYVLIALTKIAHVSGHMQAQLLTARHLAAAYLSKQVNTIHYDNVFQLAITTYALSLTSEKSSLAYRRLKSLQKSGRELYWSDLEITPTPSSMQNNMLVLEWRNESQTDAYAVHTTATALLASIKHGATTYERNSIMRWLQEMRNYIGGFSSTQDTLVAMEALVEFTKLDLNRNVFDLTMKPLSTAKSTENDGYRATVRMTSENYTHMYSNEMPHAWGYVKMSAIGSGRAVLGVVSEYNVQYWEQLETPQIESFNLTVDSLTWGGRNYSLMYMTVCARWHYVARRLRTGLAVMEVELPTAYAPNPDDMRDYVKSGVVPNLKYMDFEGRTMYMYFTYLDNSKTCVEFWAERQFNVARLSEEHYMMVYDYYEPGHYNTSLYTTVNLFHMDLCYGCASYQCPYCPDFNTATIHTITFGTFLFLLIFSVFCNLK